MPLVKAGGRVLTMSTVGLFCFECTQLTNMNSDFHGPILVLHIGDASQRCRVTLYGEREHQTETDEGQEEVEWQQDSARQRVPLDEVAADQEPTNTTWNRDNTWHTQYITSTTLQNWMDGRTSFVVKFCSSQYEFYFAKSRVRV